MLAEHGRKNHSGPPTPKPPSMIGPLSDDDRLLSNLYVSDNLPDGDFASGDQSFVQFPHSSDRASFLMMILDSHALF
jgi:hypothetical protein